MNQEVGQMHVAVYAMPIDQSKQHVQGRRCDRSNTSVHVQPACLHGQIGHSRLQLNELASGSWRGCAMLIFPKATDFDANNHAIKHKQL